MALARKVWLPEIVDLQNAATLCLYFYNNSHLGCYQVIFYEIFSKNNEARSADLGPALEMSMNMRLRQTFFKNLWFTKTYKFGKLTKKSEPTRKFFFRY